MKRSKPLRSDPDATRAWQDRSRETAIDRARDQPARSSLRDGEDSRKRPRSLSRRPRRKTVPVAASERELNDIAREEWHARITRRPYLMCLAFPASDELRRTFGPDLRRREARHVVAQRHLKREGLHTQLWNTDNGVCLCRYHHAQHEAGSRRVPRRLLPMSCERFASDMGLAHVLDREYTS